MKITLFIVVSISLAFASHCTSSPGQGEDNNLPFYDEQPIFLNSSKNGKLFTIGSDDQYNKQFLLHVWGIYNCFSIHQGTPYEMGYAQGELLKDQVTQFMTQVNAYIKSELASDIPDWVPEATKKLIAKFGIEGALDFTYEATSHFTNHRFYDELQGIADASGVDFKILRRIHLIGELTKGHCSMFGAWGTATTQGQTIQLRALDWDMDGPFSQFPLVTVYHPNSDNGNSWINIGYMGWAGVLSGISEKQLAVSEIGVSYPDETYKGESRFGDPFTFLLREVLQYDNTLEDATKRMGETTKTCNLILGVGDGKKQTSSFKSYAVSHKTFEVVDENHFIPVDEVHHPPIQDIVYHAMDWTCINWSARLKDLLTTYHGQIDLETTARHIVPQLTSGDTQAVIYDLANMQVLIAYNSKASGHQVKAFNRNFIKLNAFQLFEESRP